jgi:hypothetical protein
MIWYHNSSSTASANALNELPVHVIVWIYQILVAGVASCSITMVAVFAAVCCVMWPIS